MVRLISREKIKPKATLGPNLRHTRLEDLLSGLVEARSNARRAAASHVATHAKRATAPFNSARRLLPVGQNQVPISNDEKALHLPAMRSKMRTWPILHSASFDMIRPLRTVC